VKPVPTITRAEYAAHLASEARTKRGHASDRYNTAGRGRREDLGGIYFRSKREANYARYLELLKSRGEIHDWEFESRTFWFEAIRRGTRSYTPDFEVWPTTTSPSYFVELKAWMDRKSATKLRRMAKYYPEVRIEVVDRTAYAALAKTIGRVIAGWEM
jgi:hypothetical protein